jgi:hypothetical protein
MLADREGATLVAIAGGAPPDPSRARTAYVRVVTSGFFAAMGIRTIAGRDFNGDDRQTTQLVAVVNQAFVQQFLAGSDPLRASLSFGYPVISAGPHTIVGVVGDVRYKALNSAPQPIVYIDQAQLFVPSLSPVFAISARAGQSTRLGSPSQISHEDALA